jgi:hypothetical protein
MTENTESGLACDHPLLEKLDFADRIVVTAHYATLMKMALVNAEILAYLRILNFITLHIQANNDLSNNQKAVLAALGVDIKGFVDRAAEKLQSTDEM